MTYLPGDVRPLLCWLLVSEPSGQANTRDSELAGGQSADHGEQREIVLVMDGHQHPM
jgi:hypothetical protein